jgi:hypothetical protein
MKTCQICAFDMSAGDIKEIDNKIYFIWEETFILILKSIKGFA